MRWLGGLRKRRAERGVDDASARHTDHRPSLSLVLSAVALFVALGGTSYALTVTSRTVKNNSLTGADIKENSLGSGDIRNGTLRRRDFRSGELPRVQNASPGTPGASGTGGPGAQGAPGAAGSALAFARVQANGTVDPNASRGIVLVAKAGAGIYCLNFTGGTPKNIMATIDISGADSRKARVSGSAIPAAVTSTCPAGSDMVLATAQDAVGNVDLPFYLAVIG